MLRSKKKEAEVVPSQLPPIDQWTRQSELLWSAHNAAKDTDIQREFRFKLEALARKHQRQHMGGAR